MEIGSSKMKTYLEAKGLLKYVELEEIQLERDARYLKCIPSMVQMLADIDLEYIKDCKSSKSIWDSLSKICERKGIKSQLYLRRKLLTISMIYKNHFLEFDKLITELRKCGAKLEESDVVCHLLFTLPKSVDALVTALDTMGDDSVTQNFVKSKLLNHQKTNSEK